MKSVTIQFDAQQLTQDLKTMVDLLRWATSRFNEHNVFFGHGTDNAWDEAVSLMLHTLYLPEQKDDTLLNARLVEDEKLQFIALVQQRINERIPAAYLTNTARFAKLSFYVDQRVLVPRSPIAELIVKQFSPLITDAAQVHRVLDLCCGSACIAIACAYAFPNAEVDALDLSDDALEVAAINIDGHDLNDRVIPIKSNVFSGVEGQTYDLIVTNPPYVDAEDMANLPPEYGHEPQMGLGCGEDGLDIVRIILQQAADHLTDGGILVCEVGNSCIHVQNAFSDVPFTWLEFEYGGHGVFALTKTQLEQFQESFK